jgi:hypothetical protein
MAVTRSPRWRRLLPIGVALLAVGAGWWWRGRPDRAPPLGTPRYPPLPRRVEVEVLNGGGVSGAARVAALWLRTGGLDVVLIENAPASLRDTTRAAPLVLVRRNDTTGVGRVREVLGEVEVRDAPDPRPLVDLTVVVGRASRDREPWVAAMRSDPKP